MHTLIIVGEPIFFYLDWREVSVGEVVVENTVNVVANKSVESGSGVGKCGMFKFKISDILVLE